MIVIDVETTGIYPNEHSIVSIGAVDFANPENQFYAECKIWEGAKIYTRPTGLGGEKLRYLSALAVNGFTEEQIKDQSKKHPGEILGMFLEWAKSCNSKVIAGHNSWFDRDFLMDTAKRYNIVWPFGGRIIDLHTLTFATLLKNQDSPHDEKGRSKIISDYVFKYVGMPEEPKPHNALTGAKFEAEAFSRLIYGKNLLKEFGQYPIPDYLKK